jgi:hypothetical protein
VLRQSARTSWHAWFALYPDKHIKLPQPPAEGPEDGEDEEALHEGAGGSFEEGVAEPGPADAADPAGVYLS